MPANHFNAYNYINTGHPVTHTQTQGRFHNHTAHNLYMIQIMATNVAGVMKIGNIAPRAGIELTSRAFQNSMITSHYLVSPMSSSYLSVWLLA